MKIVYSALFLLLSSIALAQPLPYEFTILTENYVAFEDGTSLTSSIEWDDDYYTAPIGFSFSYMDSTYDMISAIGIFGGLGSELVLGEYDTTGKYDIMCPALLDLVDAEGAEQSDISYITTGEPGSRIFKLQWTNCALYGDNGPTNARIEMQVWLFEATNSIDFRYGLASNLSLQDYLFLNGMPVYIGNDCEVGGDPGLPTNIWILTGDAATADIQSLQTLNEFFTGVFLEDYPANGLVYHFEGTPDNVNNIEAEALLAYPTISESTITISGISPNSTLAVLDMTGKMLETSTIQSTTFVLDISRWSSGLYFVEVFDGNAARTTKFIKK
ncbi:MAG: T9SS type A sorting domain-containing protein [Flavobacteriales bacterium]